MPQDRSNADVDPTSRCIILRLNSQGIIQWASDSIGILSDHDETTVVGENFFELFPTESFEQAAEIDNDSRSSIRTYARFDQKKIHLKTRHFEHAISGTQTVIAVEFSAEMEKAHWFLTESQTIHQKLNQLEEEKVLLQHQLAWHNRGATNTLSFSHDYFLRWLPDGKLVECDEQFCRVFGPANNEGLNFFSLIDKQNQLELKNHLNSFSQKAPAQTVRFQALLGDGKVHWCEQTDVAVFDDNDAISEFHSIGRVDSQDAGSLVDSVSEWLSELIHDTKQPLQAIRFSASTMDILLGQEFVDRNSLLQLSSRISESVTYANSLLAHYQRFSKQGQFNRQPGINLGDIGRNCLSIIQHRINENGVQLQVSIENVMVACDEVQIKQLLVNLLSNAIESVTNQPEQERQIRLAITDEESAARLVVSDNGPGIPDLKSEEIFKLFHTSKQQHFGIGLAICQKIVDLHQGELSHESRPTGGSNFVAIIPKH